MVEQDRTRTGTGQGVVWCDNTYSKSKLCKTRLQYTAWCNMVTISKMREEGDDGDGPGRSPHLPLQCLCTAQVGGNQTFACKPLDMLAGLHME